MTWNPIQIKGLSYLSPTKAPATVEFEPGLNIVFGASNTGKSFIVESIDYLLGSSGNLRDIQERVAYDRMRLLLEASNDTLFTIQRGVKGGGFVKFEGTWLEEEPDHEGIVLQAKYSANNQNNLSSFFLSLIGLEGKSVIKNKRQDLQSFTIRNLVRFLLVKEEEIIRSSSPILSGQYTTATAEYSAFRLLLTGVDDSAQIAQEQRQREVSAAKQSLEAKVELLDELIAELHSGLREVGVNRIEAEDQIARLSQEMQANENRIAQVREQLGERITRRNEILSQIQRLTNSIQMIEGQLSRFGLLQQHYQSDLERLASIEESGSFLIDLNMTPCPLCGTPPNEQHLSTECDGNIEATVVAARGEIAKVQKLSFELEQTASELESELDVLRSQQNALVPEYQELNQVIERITAPLGDLQTNIGELASRVSDYRLILRRFEDLEEYRKRKDALVSEASTEPDPDPERNLVDVATSVLDEYAQVVQQLLQLWGFPGTERVHFDMSKKDLVINGQLRSSSGKGVRAITHAAMIIGLMEFCRQEDLPHPGFVVLDSPLLAYREPESEEDSALAESDLKTRFYEYLAMNLFDSQAIIIENEDPPIDLGGRVHLTHFTKNENVGRYGFFPA